MIWRLLLLTPLVLAGTVLAFNTVYHVFFLLASLPALWRDRRRSQVGSEPVTRFLVVVPAHNEASLIAGTVATIRDGDYPAHLRDIVVIADNCTDNTAEIARAQGASCLERQDPSLRGKPYALAWAFEQTDLGPYGGVVIMDGDTNMDRGFLRAMDTHLRSGESAIQGYFGVMNPDENWLTRLSIVPATLKFRLHFPGKQAFGLSCPLAGNGMCFSGDVIRRYGWNAFSLTENWEYYVRLTLEGYVCTSAPEAVIYSEVVRSLKEGQTQRTRWMKGRMDTLQSFWRPLLFGGFARGSLVRIDALCEVAALSHSMLLLWTILYAAACGLLSFAGLVRVEWAWFGAALLLAQGGYLLSGLIVQRPPLRTWIALTMVPLYLVWKLMVSVKGVLNYRDRTWVKTNRNS
jgi:1,2-diacylglycerol 3-beta-glucosyltransferase